MRFIDRVDPDVVQPYRNLVDDDYEESGLKRNRSQVRAATGGAAVSDADTQWLRRLYRGV